MKISPKKLLTNNTTCVIIKTMKEVVIMTNKARINRLKENGYNPIHLVKNFYLVRNYSKKYKKYSLYGIMYIK